jgi:hypothetical protein
MGIYRPIFLANYSYKCKYCNTHIGVSSDIKRIDGMSRDSSCYEFRNLYNYVMGDSVNIQIFKGEGVFLVDGEAGGTGVDVTTIFCMVCNANLGWKLKPYKFILCKNKVQ